MAQLIINSVEEPRIFKRAQKLFQKKEEMYPNKSENDSPQVIDLGTLNYSEITKQIESIDNRNKMDFETFCFLFNFEANLLLFEFQYKHATLHEEIIRDALDTVSGNIRGEDVYSILKENISYHLTPIYKDYDNFYSSDNYDIKFWHFVAKTVGENFRNSLAGKDYAASASKKIIKTAESIHLPF